MARRSLTWHLFPSYLLVILVSLVAVVGYSARSVRQLYVDQASHDLEARAQILSGQLGGYLAGGAVDDLQAQSEQLAAVSDTRITVVLPSGDVVADSQETVPELDNASRNRPEFVDALNGVPGSSIRYSVTERERMMYVAVPVQVNGKIVGAVRAAIPTTAVDEALWDIFARIVLAGAVVAVLAAAVSWVVSRRITRPIQELTVGAERFSRGDLGTPLRVNHSREIAALADAMNRMAEELDLRLENALRQKNEQDAVLAGMVEGVLAVDSDDRLFIINEAAARLLEVDRFTALGKPVTELIRNSSFQDFVARTVKSDQPVEGELTFHLNEDVSYQAHGTVLKDADGDEMGAVFVLHDVTQLRRLERIRSDFVSNVSHELRTPVTSIKGFVETLIESPPENEAEAKRFLSIVAKHANQLNTLIGDLLSLARIEQGEEQAEEKFEDTLIESVLSDAVDACAHLAEDKRVRVTSECPPELRARVNPSLLQQAVANLLDNAIKYSEPEKSVELEAAQNNGNLVIAVRDQGAGVASHHLSRLFERFYRVDKARSRELGGTGLGLSIVRHIAELHHGTVEARSRVGQGSTFEITIPIEHETKD